MKQIIGTFYNNTEEEFKRFINFFEEKGFEIARQGNSFQAVVIEECPEENTEELEKN